MPVAPRIYVLDTNVLIHDPVALFRFAEHDVFIPLMVLEELDAAKNGRSEVAQNARQASRFLDGVLGSCSAAEIRAGIPLVAPASHLEGRRPSGRLLLQTEALTVDAHDLLRVDSSDNLILKAVLGLRRETTSADVVLVSKDINVRIKARVLGIPVEDYHSDKVLDDIQLLYSGVLQLDAQGWEKLKQVAERGDGGSGELFLNLTELPPVGPNQFICVAEDDGPGWRVLPREGGRVRLAPATDYQAEDALVWGIRARNREQSLALNLLMDPQVEFVSLIGVAGTGKTLLALAAGLTQCMDTRLYREIIMTRATLPVGEDIGFLPGTEEEKMTPWMGALLDNLEVLTDIAAEDSWARNATDALLEKRIKIRSLNFMRGRTFLNRFVIIDEAQNLTAKQMKTLITRAGPGTKLVCLGNLSQIDSPYLSETTSGLTYVIDRFRNWERNGHIGLQRGERSPLADYASQNL